jgi:hypothetical protein
VRVRPIFFAATVSVAGLAGLAGHRVSAAPAGQSAQREVWVNPNPVLFNGYIDVEGRNFQGNNIVVTLNAERDSVNAGPSYGTSMNGVGTFDLAIRASDFGGFGTHFLWISDYTGDQNDVSVAVRIDLGNGQPAPTPVLAPWHTGPAVLPAPPPPQPGVGPPPALIPSPGPSPSSTPTATFTPTATPTPTATVTATATPSPTPTSRLVITSFYVIARRHAGPNVRVGPVVLSATVRLSRLPSLPVHVNWVIGTGAVVAAHHGTHAPAWVGDRVFTWTYSIRKPGQYVVTAVAHVGSDRAVQAIAFRVTK